MIVARYQRILFGFILSLASFTREQAFEIAISSWLHALKQKSRITADGEFLEELFREAIRQGLQKTPAGSPDLSAFGDLTSQNKESLKIVRQALVGLPDKDKYLLLLRDQCHFTFERIAGILGVAPLQARSSCLESRERLRATVQSVLEKKTGHSNGM